MDNLKLPAYPQPITLGSDGSILTPLSHDSDFSGFTKLEKAALMIAQGMAQKWGGAHAEHIASESVAIAKAVLEEANK